MRKKELLRMIQERAKSCGITFRKSRSGSNHDIYTLGNTTLIIGRHSTLKPNDARATLNQTESELGAKWWQQ
jgi:hypothetical protein